MWFKDYINNKGEITLSVDKAIDILLSGGNTTNLILEDCLDVNKNNLNTNNKIITSHSKLKWVIPEKYQQIDIKEFFNQFSLSKDQQTRVDQELNIFKKYNLDIVIKLMIYIVDFMKENNIVWGVGRGSSVSSYLLFLIGVHKVDSFKYNLDIKEFIK